MPRSQKAPDADSVPTLKAAARRIKAPLHAQIRESLRSIIENEFEDGQRFYTERDLIKHLGASLLTVRRALTDLATEGLLVRKVGSGTHVRKGGALKSVGVFLPDYTSPVLLQMLDELANAARSGRARLNVYHTHKGESAREALLYVQSSPQEEGILLLGNTTDVNLTLHADLAARGFRVVLLNNCIEGLPVTCVGLDDRKTVEAGLDHLRGLGHSRILFLVSEPLEGAGVRAKHDAMERLLAARRLKESSLFVCGTKAFEDSYDAAYRRMPEIMGRTPRPTAIFAVSDAGALGALRYCLEQHVPVPGEISVLGINNSPSSRFAHPALTTFALPMKKIAEKALQLLAKKEPPGRTFWFPPELIERESTGRAPK